jgi:chorismate lyase / 3-hydroxybenzoate synthase
VSVALQARTPVSVAPLVFRRWHADTGAPAAPTARPLGGRGVGAGTGLFANGLLSAEGAVFDHWSAGAELHTQHHGCVHYTSDGQWLHGHAEVDDAALQGGLHAAARQAYTDLFSVLAHSRSPHLLRLWNYIARINAPDSDGQERYRHFNAGRQQAFIDARRSAFDGTPAACALGTTDGPLRVYFLAGPRAPLAIENPRQISAYRYPASYGARSPTFSRAALADVGGDRLALFISGTASIVGHTTLHIGDVRRQTEESLANMAAVREVAALRAGAPFDASVLIYTVYVRHRGDFAAVREVFERHVGPSSAAAREAVYLQADICRAELLVEIEAHAFARQESPV